MTVPGLTVNDNIKIECVLYVLGKPGVRSDPAYLRVQGSVAAITSNNIMILAYNCIDNT